MTKSAVRGALCALMLILMPAPPAGAVDSDSAVYVELQDGSGTVSERWKLYGSSQALVIGIDDYSNGWPRLSNAIEDAEAVAAELEARGFEVTKLLNPGGEKLRSELRSFFALKGADPDARLFVWFAGHGYTEFGEGYLVPADAPDPSNPEFRLTALHMGDVGSMVRIARSKHVFAVFDACFAGTIFNASRARPPAAITRAVTEPVRQFLTSGDADQQVSDNGSFRKLFIKALNGREAGDANGDGYLTGTELSLFLEDRVVNLTNSAQTPRSGKLRDQRFDQGDFVFLLPQPEQVQVAAIDTADAAAGTRALPAIDRDLAVELAFWDAIKASESASDYRAYLTAYPEGQFVPLAQARIAELEARVARLEAEQARMRQEEEARRQAEAEQAAQLAALQKEPQLDPAEEAELALGLNRADRKELQAALTALGHDTGGIDGFFGPATRGAIRSYQAAKGEARTGFLTASLAGRLIAEAPKPEPKLEPKPAPEPEPQTVELTPQQAEQTQTAALPPQPAVSKQEVQAYAAANHDRLTRQFLDYNHRWRLLLEAIHGRPPNKINLSALRVKEVSGDEIVATATLQENRSLGRNFYNPASLTTDFLFKWTGSGLEIVGHKDGYEMRRTGG